MWTELRSLAKQKSGKRMLNKRQLENKNLFISKKTGQRIHPKRIHRERIHPERIHRERIHPKRIHRERIKRPDGLRRAPADAPVWASGGVRLNGLNG